MLEISKTLFVIFYLVVSSHVRLQVVRHNNVTVYNVMLSVNADIVQFILKWCIVCQCRLSISSIVCIEPLCDLLTQMQLYYSTVTLIGVLSFKTNSVTVE